MRPHKADLTPVHYLVYACVGAAVCLLTALTCVMFGQVSIGRAQVLAALGGRAVAPEFHTIVISQRLPRVILALVAGGGLAVSGAVFQALLRNPLATPHTLGVSAGGALGAVAAISFGWNAPAFGPVRTVQFFSLAGSFGIVGIVYLLARGRRAIAPTKLLLAGVTLGLICSALVMFVRFASDPHKLVMVDRWLMGGLDIQGFRDLGAVLPFAMPAITLMFMEAPALDQLAMGKEMAAGRGVDVEAVQLRAFLAGSTLTASVVSVAGPIGFVGLIIPHVLRLAFGPDHRLLLLLSLFTGGAFLAVADTFARTAFAPSELPVGVLTAMLGGPFFLALLVSRRGLGQSS